ncbi:response regulator [Pedococcus bigeumensis]|uniref:DNA-binding response regulator n=1 Tax=Pedococcus bigeumensis TaxID=433644 RepID=A0A502CVH5_9MICO|nr:response regulator transcription factor [Pedococcus bigeumensis]TPG16813.1 DNA-binding response regulator [Pedococcus bigeumensis]
MTGDPVRVVLVDDQELVRVGFRLVLERAGFAVVGEAADGLQAVAVARQTTPDVVLMDVRMPRMDGIEATRRIVAAHPRTRVLALTTFDLDRFVYAAVSAGASGFLLKDVPPDDLAHAVRVVARGEAMLAPVLTRRLLERFTSSPTPGQLPSPLRDLPERDLDILRLVARGLSNAEIGTELHLSLSTVKTYVSRLLTHLNLRDRLQLAVLAYESGLVTPGR